MPYVSEEDRNRIEEGNSAENAGQLNYSLAIEVDQYIQDKGLSYQTLNDISGVLTNLNLEVYRRITSIYEDEKIRVNGDVFHFSLRLLKTLLPWKFSVKNVSAGTRCRCRWVHWWPPS
jgi:hypothetical protein